MNVVHACMPSNFNCVWLFATLGTGARQAPLSLGFSRQEYWSGLPCPPPKDLHDPGIESSSPTSYALADGFFTTSAIWEAQLRQYVNQIKGDNWKLSAFN